MMIRWRLAWRIFLGWCVGESGLFGCFELWGCWVGTTTVLFWLMFMVDLRVGRQTTEYHQTGSNYINSTSNCRLFMFSKICRSSLID